MIGDKIVNARIKGGLARFPAHKCSCHPTQAHGGVVYARHPATRVQPQAHLSACFAMLTALCCGARQHDTHDSYSEQHRSRISHLQGAGVRVQSQRAGSITNP